MTDAQLARALKILKVDIGLVESNTTFDEFLKQQLKGAYGELETQGCLTDMEQDIVFNWVCDYAAWQYRKRANDKELNMPRNLQFRRNNLRIKRALRKG